MSDTFTFVAPVMPRRKADPFAVRLAVFGVVLAVLISAFAVFVISEERAADARHATLEARVAAEEQAKADDLVAASDAAVPASPGATAPVPGAVANVLDGQARDAAERALALARGALGRPGGLAAADAATLAGADPSLLFVDGPSTAPSVVSVAVAGGSWAAAVMGPSGSCYWVSVNVDGVVRYDRSRTCTGRAALAADRTAW